jgi:hypothetical protein
MNDDINSVADDAVGLERVTASLRQVPNVRHDATDRIVAAALAQEGSRRRRPTTWMLRAAAIMLAAGLGAAGVWYGERDGTAARQSTVAATAASDRPASPGGPAQFASAQSGDEAPVSIPFALSRPNARRVAVVGDFDEWSPTAVPMTRDGAGTWTATVALAPGRHAYAFVVDDSVWVTDPRAPLERDADYGRSHSIIIVGHP